MLQEGTCEYAKPQQMLSQHCSAPYPYWPVFELNEGFAHYYSSPASLNLQVMRMSFQHVVPISLKLWFSRCACNMLTSLTIVAYRYKHGHIANPDSLQDHKRSICGSADPEALSPGVMPGPSDKTFKQRMKFECVAIATVSVFKNVNPFLPFLTCFACLSSYWLSTIQSSFCLKAWCG